MKDTGKPFEGSIWNSIADEALRTRENTPAPPPPATDPHEPKEPRRAPTREVHGCEDGRPLCGIDSVGGLVMRGSTLGPVVTCVVCIKIATLAAERDEWKRRAEESQSEAVRIAQVHQHEWVMRASAREAFENYVVRVMAASGADSNFDDCFRNIIVEYDKSLARVDKAEAERDAARALVRDLRDPSPCDHFDHHGYCQTHGWMETDPPCPHRRATKFLEALGEGK